MNDEKGYNDQNDIDDEGKTITSSLGGKPIDIPNSHSYYGITGSHSDDEDNFDMSWKLGERMSNVKMVNIDSGDQFIVSEPYTSPEKMMKNISKSPKLFRKVSLLDLLSGAVPQDAEYLFLPGVVSQGDDSVGSSKSPRNGSKTIPISPPYKRFQVPFPSKNKNSNMFDNNKMHSQERKPGKNFVHHSDSRLSDIEEQYCSSELNSDVTAKLVELAPLMMEISELRALKSEFDRFDPDHRGLDCEQFKRATQNFLDNRVHDIPAVFRLFDIEKKNRVTLKEFVCGYFVLCRGSTEDRLRYLFSMYDDSGQNVLFRPQLRKVAQVMNFYSTKIPVIQGGDNLTDETFTARKIMSEQDIDNLVDSFLRFNGHKDYLNYNDFVQVCERHPALTSWLDDIAELTGEHLKTLRETKGEELLRLELHRMGLIDGSDDMPSPQRKIIDDELSIPDSPEACGSINLRRSIGSNGSFGSRNSSSHFLERQSIGSNGSLDSRNSSVHLQRKASGRVHGPVVSIRRTKDASSDSPFAIDFDTLKLLTPIGSGTYATVWKGEWLHMPVAVKIFHTQPKEHDDNYATQTLSIDVNAYLREIEVLSQLRHPNVLLYMGACITPGKPRCIVTELYNGGSVYELLHGQNSTKLDTIQVMTLALGIARGMLYLHSSTPTILHRDLKANNVLVDKEISHCVLCDFGLSKALDVSGTAESQQRDTVGTPYTMAPEVMEGGTYTKAADVYSFGIVLWEIWTASVPFKGLKPIQLMFQVYAENVRPPFEEEHKFHPKIKDLIERCWSADQNERPEFEEILDILEDETFQQELIESATRTRAERKLAQLCSAMMDAVVAGDEEQVLSYLKQGASASFADYDKRTPLHIAASEGHIGIVTLLLEHHADPSAVDRWNSTPLDDAIREGHPDVIDILQTTVGVEPSSGQLRQMYIALELMINIHNGDIAKVKKLVSREMNINFSDYDNRTPLHIAAADGKYPEIVSFLLENGADATVRDRWGSTPLHDAQRSGCREIMLLIERAMKMK